MGVAAGERGFEELIAVDDRDGDNAVGTRTGERFERCLLDESVARRHHHVVGIDVVLVLEVLFPNGLDRADTVIRRNLDQVAYRAAFRGSRTFRDFEDAQPVAAPLIGEDEQIVVVVDRKSTRLNSSHVAKSYAVFCLKKKREGKERGR